MTALPIPDALLQGARALGLYTLVNRSPHTEILTEVMVYRDQNAPRALVTWTRASGLRRRQGYAWAQCTLAEAHEVLHAAVEQSTPVEREEPHGCECDQVQALRVELVGALAETSSAAAEIVTLTDQVEELRKSLAKAHAASSAAGAQLRRTQELLTEAHAASSAAGAQLRTTQELLTEAHMRASKAEQEQERDRERERAKREREYAKHAGWARQLADEAMKRARTKVVEVEALLAAERRTRHRAIETACLRHQEHTELLGLVRRCLAKMPPEMEHGGCLETAVDMLLTADHDETASVLDLPCMDGETWIPAEDVTQAMLDAWPAWEARRASHPRIWAWLASDWYAISLIHDASVRPLRLPGMNAKGEIRAEDMRPKFFGRVRDWQWRSVGARRTIQPTWTRNTRWGWNEVGIDDELWRPAIFAQLDGES